MVTLSKFLSYLLRHGAEKEGLVIGIDGYAKVADILAMPQARKSRYTLEQVRTVVDNNDKKRFALKQDAGAWLIRANQGHTDQRIVDLELTPITSADQLPAGLAVHGTYYDAWKTIKTEGLSRMSRNHIHFAVGEVGANEVISGMRRSTEVMIYLDVAKALAAGIPLFLSANRVVLSPGVGEQGVIKPEYFLAVVRTSDKKAFDPAFPQLPPKAKWIPSPPATPVGGEMKDEKKEEKSAQGEKKDGQSAGATPANRKRNLERRLLQIEELKNKKAAGAELNADQLAKIEKEAEIKREIAAIGDV